MKNSLFLISLVLLVLFSCTNYDNRKEYFHLMGKAQGTTFSIKYHQPDKKVFDKEVDSILKKMDQQLSLYINHSVISKFNNSDHGIQLDSLDDQYFIEMMNQSKMVYTQTNGYFNPCVKPLYNYWNFDNIETGVQNIDSTMIDSLLQLTKFDSIQLSNEYFIEKPLNYQLDFNAIAQGYSVDVIGDFFLANQVTDYMIEIGGEAKAHGLNPNNKTWTIGIEKPEVNQSEDYQKIVMINNEAIATSGSYRKFFELNGKKYAHVINPHTGFPIQHSLLSVTVIHNESSLSDAYSTASLSMGLNQSKNLLKDLKLRYFMVSDRGGEFMDEDGL